MNQPSEAKLKYTVDCTRTETLTLGEKQRSSGQGKRVGTINFSDVFPTEGYGREGEKEREGGEGGKEQRRFTKATVLGPVWRCSARWKRTNKHLLLTSSLLSKQLE